VFPNEKRELSAGCTEDTVGGRAGGLLKRAGQAAEKGSPPARPFPLSSLMCSLLARLNNVQPSGPTCSAVCRPAFLCSSPARGKFMFYIWQHGSSVRPVRRPSV